MSPPTPASVSACAADVPAAAQEIAPSHADYAKVCALLTLFAGWLTFAVQRAGGHALRAPQLLGPLLTLALLVALVWLVMLVFRNYAVLSGMISGAYFRRFDVEPPPEWVERPARTFNNLMQVPPLFYLVCVLMLHTGRADQAQLWLAWTFVGTRYVHALVYAGWNYLPWRFGAFVASFITLIVLYVRFTLQVSDLL